MSEWQPIETAPKDGTRVLLFPQYCVAHWEFGDENWMIAPLDMSEMPVEERFKGTFYCIYPEVIYEDGVPTHWMPLPEPPQ